jgi:serine/threonine-protein kinase HipA
MTVLEVYLEQFTDAVGVLSAEAGVLAFHYEAEYLNRRNAVPLSLSLPLRKEAYDHEPTRAFFANLLPEGRQLAHLARRHDIDETDVAGLLTYAGAECAGAVSVILKGAPPPKRPGRFPSDYERLSDDALGKLLSDLVEGRLPDIEEVSLAGVQSKTAVLVDESGIVHRAIGNAPTTHILKVADGRFPGGVENELFCMRLAHALGFETAEVEMRRHGGTPFLLVRRYDRDISLSEDGFLVRRLHQEDFSQAKGLYPVERKYTHRGGLPGEAFFELQVAKPALFRQALLGAYLLNFLIGNSDAHAKNFSLLHKGGRDGTSLAPLYDLTCVRLYPDFRQGMALSIGGQQEYEKIDAAAWDAFAAETTLGRKYLRSRIGKLARSVIPTARRIRDAGSFTEPVAGRIINAIGDQVALVNDAFDLKVEIDTAPFLARAPGWAWPS